MEIDSTPALEVEAEQIGAKEEILESVKEDKASEGIIEGELPLINEVEKEEANSVKEETLSEKEEAKSEKEEAKSEKEEDLAPGVAQENPVEPEEPAP